MRPLSVSRVGRRRGAESARVVENGFAGGGGVVDGGFRRAAKLEDGLAAGAAGHTGGSVQVDDSDGEDADRGAVQGDGGGDGSLLGA